MIGKSVSHYNILEKLGAGGMGEVYLADDKSLDRQVAVKVLPDIFGGDPEQLARFEPEAKLLGQGLIYRPTLSSLRVVEPMKHLFPNVDRIEGGYI